MFQFIQEAFQGPHYLSDWCLIANLCVLFLCVLFGSSYEIWERYGKLIENVYVFFLIPWVFLIVVPALNHFNIKVFHEMSLFFPRNVAAQIFCYIVSLVVMVVKSKIWKKYAKKWYEDNVAFYDKDIAYYEAIIKSEVTEDHAELVKYVKHLKQDREEVLSNRPYR